MRFILDVRKTKKRKKHRFVEWISTSEILRDFNVGRALNYLYMYVYKQPDLQNCIGYIYRVLMFSPRMIKRWHYFTGRWGFWFLLLPLTCIGVYLVSYILAQILGGWVVLLSATFLFSFFGFLWVNFKSFFHIYFPEGIKRLDFFTGGDRKRSAKYLVNTSLRMKYFLIESNNEFKLKSVNPKRRWNLGRTDFHEYEFFPPKPLNWVSEFTQHNYKNKVSLIFDFLNNEKFILPHHTSYYKNNLVVDPLARSNYYQEQLKNFIINNKKLPLYEKEFRLMGLIKNSGNLSIEKIYSKNCVFDSNKKKQAIMACYVLCWIDKFGNKDAILALGPWFIDSAVHKPWYVLLSMSVYKEAFDRGFRIRSDIDKLRISSYKKSSILGPANVVPLPVAAAKPSLLSRRLKVFLRYLRRLPIKVILRRFRRKLWTYVRFFRTQLFLKYYYIWLFSVKFRWLRENLWSYILLEYYTQSNLKSINDYIFWYVDSLGCKYLKWKDLQIQRLYLWKDKHYTPPIERKHIIFLSTFYDYYLIFFKETLPNRIISKIFIPWFKKFVGTLVSVFFKDVWRLIPILFVEGFYSFTLLYKRFLKFMKHNLKGTYLFNNNDKDSYQNNGHLYDHKPNTVALSNYKDHDKYVFGCFKNDAETIVGLIEDCYDKFTIRNRRLISLGIRSNITMYEQRLILKAEMYAWTNMWAGFSYDETIRYVLKYSTPRPWGDCPPEFGTLAMLDTYLKRNVATEINNYIITPENSSNVIIAVHGALHFDHLIRLSNDSKLDKFKDRYKELKIAHGSWVMLLHVFGYLARFNETKIFNRDFFFQEYVSSVLYSHVDEIEKYKRYRGYHRIHKSHERLYWKLDAFVPKIRLFRTLVNIKVGVPKYKRYKLSLNKKNIDKLKHQYLNDHTIMIWLIYKSSLKYPYIFVSSNSITDSIVFSPSSLFHY